MDVKERSQKLLDEFNEEARVTLESKYNTQNHFVNKALDLLEEEGFSIHDESGNGPYSGVLLSNQDTEEAVIVLYPNGMMAFDDKGNEFMPLIFRGPIKSMETPEPDFLVDYIAEKLWNDQTKSTGYKVNPLQP